MVSRNQTIFGLWLFRLCHSRVNGTSSFFAGFHQTGEGEQPAEAGGAGCSTDSSVARSPVADCQAAPP